MRFESKAQADAYFQCLKRLEIGDQVELFVDKNGHRSDQITNRTAIARVEGFLSTDIDFALEIGDQILWVKTSICPSLSSMIASCLPYAYSEIKEFLRCHGVFSISVEESLQTYSFGFLNSFSRVARIYKARS